MADLVTSQILENGPRHLIAKFTSLSDGTGETGVTKIDATSTGPYGVQSKGQLFYPGIHLEIVALWFSITGMVLRVQWHATTNVDIFNLSQADNWHFLDMRGGFPGVCPPTGVAGITGSIDFTTAAAAANSAYTIILKCAKNVGQG